MSATITIPADLEKRIAELTSEEVMAAMRSHIDPKRLFIVNAGDFSAKDKTADATAK